MTDTNNMWVITRPETNIILAASAAVTLPVLILFGFTQRQFIEGITAGAIK